MSVCNAGVTIAGVDGCKAGWIAVVIHPDDLLDAAVLAVTAARYARGEARSFPAPPARDSHGLPVAIWV